ncbi:hypothetical protein LCGC14_2227460 [marine sediment metagenome]|uniref:Uncharacterized protein n=1 Tax=marine sediment metagenome TaxID=412755 RepID=A0A0F9FLQ9_9ZZZZ
MNEISRSERGGVILARTSREKLKAKDIDAFLILHGWEELSLDEGQRRGIVEYRVHPNDCKNTHKAPLWPAHEAARIELSGQQFKLVEQEGWALDSGVGCFDGYLNWVRHVRSPAAGGRRRRLKLTTAFDRCLGAGWPSVERAEEPPELRAEVIADTNVVRVWCVYCGCWHTHEKGTPGPTIIDKRLGHRVALCKADTPYKNSGYFLKAVIYETPLYV